MKIINLKILINDNKIILHNQINYIKQENSTFIMFTM